MPDKPVSKPKVPLFLDTTIIVDQVIGTNPHRTNSIQSLISSDDYKLACAYSRLEYKRVVIQNFSLTLDYLCESKRFSHAILRSNALQRQRRRNTLVNIAAWVLDKVGNESFEIPEDQSTDELLAERAISYLRVAIKSAWRQFSIGVDDVVDALNCQRALEKPREKSRGGVDVTIHESACRDKGCNIANFFQSQGSVLKRLLRTLEKLPEDQITEELAKARETIEAAFSSPSKLYDYNTCLKMADVWIHLECLKAGSTRFLTTNYKESKVLCPAIGLKMLDANEQR